MKHLIIILFLFSSLVVNSQYSTHRIFDNGENYKDTVLIKDGTDSLFRLFEGEYIFAGIVRTKVFISANEVANLATILSAQPIPTATQAALDSKQATLVSGTSIKTINNTSLLGSGNISIVGGGEAFPIGSVFISVVATNPNTLLGYGTWEAFAPGRMLVGFDNTNPNFDAAEETGGTATVTIAASNLPELIVAITDPGHVHVQNKNTATTGPLSGATPDASTNTSAASGYSTASATTGITATANTGGANNSITILNPYITVYMWKRTN